MSKVAPERRSQSIEALVAPARPGATLQRRGAQRVQAIVDAGSQLLEEGGYAAATLKAISERSGIPLASVYHYFADRHQVDAEILKRHVEALDEVIPPSVQGVGSEATVGEVVGALIGPMVDYFRRHPSVVELWFYGRSETLSDIVSAYDDANATLLWETLIGRGLLASNTSLQVVRLASEAASRLFDCAFRAAPPKGDDVIISEMYRMVTAYLCTYAPDL